VNVSRSILALGVSVALVSPFASAQSAKVKLSQSQLKARVSRAMEHHSGTPGADPSNGMTVTTPATATALATALLGSGVSLSGTPTFQGAPAQAGTFTTAPSLVGFSSGIILSSGNVADAGSTWIGADLPTTDETSATGGNGGLGYAPLNALIGGQATNDAAVLQFSFIPTTSTIYFSYVFASAEYPQYIGSFNDPMGLFVNGTAPSNNVAILPIAGNIPVTINNVNAATNSQFFNKYNGSGDNLPYGGETKVLTATVAVNPNVVNTITLSVADALDHVLDTAVFIQAGSLSTTPTTPTTPATPVPSSLILAMFGLAALGIFVALQGRRARV
jgi:hypothetical protein